jgi:hypothetical protein
MALFLIGAVCAVGLIGRHWGAKAAAAPARGSGLYVGVVAYNQKLMVQGLTQDLGAVRKFINRQSNDSGFRAMCAAVSAGVDEFKNFKKSRLDEMFIVTIAGGDDNYSVYARVSQSRAYAEAEQALASVIGGAGIQAYAIGFGTEIHRQEEFLSLVSKPANDYYARVFSGWDLQTKLTAIARNILSPEESAVLMVQNVLWTEEYPRFFRITISGSGGDASVICKYANTIVTILDHVGDSRLEFTPGKGSSIGGGKRIIPLNNVRYYDYANRALPYNPGQLTVEVSESADGSWRRDSEEACFVRPDAAKNIGVMIILDCASPPDDMPDALQQMKAAANAFIDELASAGR